MTISGKFHLGGLALLLAFAPLCPAADPSKAFDDPEKAAAEDPDFLVQGEYNGTFKDNEGDHPLGIQVIALGGGMFHAVAYPGGLPGDGWTGQEKFEADGKREGQDVVLAKDDTKAILRDGQISLVNADGAPFGTLKKVQRASSTLGMKPPAGAVVLFDGMRESMANWKQVDRISQDGLLMEGVDSKQAFGDHTVHLEFRLPYQPYARGQGRGNSGMYLQGRYEVQMLDSFGLAGKDNECGGIYSIKDPDLNMCYPPLTWQTYDVDYTAARYDPEGKKIANARMTVKHNGVLVHKDVELTKATTAAPAGESKEQGPINLQNHGNPVRYRNIWVVVKK